MALPSSEPGNWISQDCAVSVLVAIGAQSPRRADASSTTVCPTAPSVRTMSELVEDAEAERVPDGPLHHVPRHALGPVTSREVAVDGVHVLLCRSNHDRKFAMPALGNHGLNVPYGQATNRGFADRSLPLNRPAEIPRSERTQT